MIDKKTNTDMTNELFEWIVEDPFYSQTFGCELRVDGYSIVHQVQDGNEYHLMDLTKSTDGGDAMIRLLYKEWYRSNRMRRGSEFADNPNLPNINEI